MNLYNNDNVEIMKELINSGTKVDAVYADCIYENTDIEWAYLCIELLKPNAIFFIQTDYHTVPLYRRYMDVNLNFINELIYVNEWGGTSKRFFSKKHDNILFYANGEDYKFYPERIQIPKVTAGTVFDKKGTGLKTPCDVFYDHASFSTMSNERVKTDGHNIQWQKPLWLIDRLLLSTTDEGDTILDPFMGSGTTAVWCNKNNRNFIGIENNKEIFELAKERLHVNK